MRRHLARPLWMKQTRNSAMLQEQNQTSNEGDMKKVTAQQLHCNHKHCKFFSEYKRMHRIRVFKSLKKKKLQKT